MSEIYEREPLISAYFRWHYGRGIKEFWGVVQNFLWFISNFFSFKLLLKTLFSPWKRLGESYGSVFDIEAFASVLVTNTLMRVVGFITRSIILVVGFFSYLLIFGASLLTFIIWVLAPFVLIGSLVLSVTFFVI